MHGTLLVLLPFAYFQKLVQRLFFRRVVANWSKELAILFEVFAVDCAGVLEEYFLGGGDQRLAHRLDGQELRVSVKRLV